MRSPVSKFPPMSSFKSFMDYAVAAVNHNAAAFARQRKEAAMIDSQMEEAVKTLAIKPPQKFCTDCKWVDMSAGIASPSMWTCKSPSVKQRFDLVSGQPYSNYCQSVRISDDCGPAGRLWEASTERE
jgi:predicted Zn-ribbon and HTH transcriptional regulator